MLHLAVVLSLMVAALTAATPAQDPCAVALRIVDQRPCVRAEDCAAFQDWTRTFGAPGTEPLTPRMAGADVALTARRPAATAQWRKNPPVFNCPARTGADPATSDEP